MSQITYLTRRDGGVFYLQCRITMISGRQRLLRFSLGVRDHHAAKPLLYRYLSWVLPMQTATDVRTLFEEIDLQARAMILEGPAVAYNKIRFRYHFLKTAWIQLVDWMTSNPSPVSDRDLYERCAEIRLVLSFIWNMIKEDCVNLDVPSFDPPWPQVAPSELGFFEHPLMDDPICTALCVDKTNGRVREVAYPGNYDPEIFINLPPAEARLRRNEALFRDLYVDPNGRPIPARPLGQLAGDHAAVFNSQFKGVQNEWFADLIEEEDRELAVMAQTPAAPLIQTAMQTAPANAPMAARSAGVSPANAGKDIPAVSKPLVHAGAGFACPGHENEKISDTLEAFFKFRETTLGNKAALEDAGLLIQFMIDFLGDLQLGSIANNDLLRFEQAMAVTPDRNGIPAEHTKSLFTRYCYGQNNGLAGLKMLSKTTYKNTWHRCLRQYFDWLRDKGYADIKYKFSLVPKTALEAKDRDAWTDEELLRFFELPLFTGCESAQRYWSTGKNFVQNELYWSYCIIYFTGMRNSEIGKLSVSEIIQKGDLWFFDLTKSKTRAGRRLVPIPRILIDLGLLDRKTDLEATRVTALFPEWKQFVNAKSGRPMEGHHLSKSWQYVKKKFSFTREELTIYGGRHTRASYYDELNIPERIRNLALGHAPKTIANGYGAKRMTLGEARLLLSKELPIEGQIASILITAKLRATTEGIGEEERLMPIRTW